MTFKKMNICVLLAVVAFALPLFAGPASPALCKDSDPIINEVPFPRNLQTSLPWTRVDGSWMAGDIQFTFNTFKEVDRTRYFSVVMKDRAISDQPVKGVGEVRANDLTLRAVFEGFDGQLLLRAYRAAPSSNSSVIIASMFQVNGANQCIASHYELSKVRAEE